MEPEHGNGNATDNVKPPNNYRELQVIPSSDDQEWLEEPPFLRQNKVLGAYGDLETYLDVQFRLLREDFIQPLRKGIHEYKKFGLGRLPNQLLDMWLYHDVHVICSVCNEDVDTRLKFDISLVGRIQWQSTKRLTSGSLVCLSNDGFRTMLFATVTNSTTRDLSKGVITVRFEKYLDAVLNITPTDTFIMAETPAYFEAYRHVLKRLQEIQDDLPFQNYIVDCDTNIQAPAYLTNQTRYDMHSLADPNYESYLSSVPVLNTARWPPLQVYKLNEVQLDAVKTALTKELTIIQGPPGTGKTYVGLKILEVLLANKDNWLHDGSNNVILVVCYTNHALDQFLEGILEFHKYGIIRVGDRSNSDRLKPFNLKEIRYTRRRNKQRKKCVYENFKYCKDKMSELKKIIDSVGYKLEESMLCVLNEETLQHYMTSEHFSCLVQTYRAAQGPTIDSWLEFTNEHRMKKEQRLDLILTGSPTMSDDEARMTRKIWSMDIAKRESLYRSWVKKYQLDLKTSIQDKEREYRQVARRLKEVLQEEDCDILAEADIIGMTTTGAAKHAAVLQTVAPRVIIVEEAAEVLEAHIVTTLNPNCQHLILIGDHQQLRPNPTVYDLARRYNLDISLFERLVKNQLHHVTLEYQHRMRPEISILMKHIYPKLKDHDSVKKFENVLGVDSNVFFISHEEEENNINEYKSKSNEHEASFILALCKYLIKQGYEPSDITILAAYTGQTSLIKRLIESDKGHFEDVRVTHIDDFQGEECKIILLSFVRSNEAGSVGFLRNDNRVCVALSRAKVGMFAVGNFKLLSQKSKLWAKIVHTLEARRLIGRHLLLRCSNHPAEKVAVSTARDFDQAQNGGCSKVCGFELQCGHTCERICHLEDMKHSNHKCTKPCEQRLECGHICLKICGDCSNTEHEKVCQQTIEKAFECGHVYQTSCSSPETAERCPTQCDKKLECGHTCRGKCGDCLGSVHKRCEETVDVTLDCGHVYSMLCYKSKKPYTCSKPCNKKLECGHTCRGKCGDCLGSVHKRCKESVDVTLDCGHVYSILCYKSKKPYTCSKPSCDYRRQGHSVNPRQCGKTLSCGHKCKRKCKTCLFSLHKPCDEIVTVTLKCGHSYQMKCCDATKPYICSRECDKTLSCGHRCMRKCRECFGSSHQLCGCVVKSS